MPVRLKNTKYYETARKLRKYFKEFSPGEVIPPVDELTALTGNSHGTVIKALSCLNAEAVIYKPKGRKRYVISNSLKGYKGSLAFIRSDFPTYSFLEGQIMRMLETSGWNIEHRIFHSFRTVGFEELLKGCSGGFLVPTAEHPERALVSKLKRLDKPVVYMNEYWSDIDINFIGVDNYAVGNMAMEYLMKIGHRDIMVLMDQPHCPSSDERVRGAFEYIKRAGENNVKFYDIHLQNYQLSREMVYHKIRSYFNEHGLCHSAIFATSFEGALGVMRACNELNISIPRQLSLICYEGESDFSDYVFPQLTSIKVDVNNYARRALAVIEGLIKEKDYGVVRKEFVKPFINFGASCLSWG